MSPNSFNVQSSVIANICLLLSNQAKRHIAPGCQLVDVTMNSPSPNDFLLRCFSPPQTKYFNSPKFSLLIILLSSSPQCTKYFPSPNFFSFSSPVLAKYFPSPNIFLLFLFLCYELSFSTPSHNMDIGGGVVIIVGKGQTDRDCPRGTATKTFFRHHARRRHSSSICWPFSQPHGPKFTQTLSSLFFFC